MAHVCDAGRVEAQRLVERRRAFEHVTRVCDAGRVQAQRLVERIRVLPRVETRAYGAGRAADLEAGNGRRRPKQRAGEGSTTDSGQGTRGERTKNMWDMVVTLEVSKLSGRLNASAYCRDSNGGM